MESLGKIKRMPFIVMTIMAVLSFANLFGLNISGFVIPLGIICFFIIKAMEKDSFKECGLDIKYVATDFKDKKLWIWVALPFIMNVVCVTISLMFLPEYIEFETVRAGAFVAVELSISSAIMFFVFALGEEIAWRAFFQNQLSKVFPYKRVIIFSSILFTLGHFKAGNNTLAFYGLFFTLINSCLYGIIFNKTKNAWTSAIVHFAANMFEVIMYVLIHHNEML